MYFVDSCVIIDLQLPASPWHDWATARVDTAAAAGLSINHLILAEVLASPDPLRARAQLDAIGFEIDALDDAIATRAATAQRLYRKRGGPRAAIIADFLIGAHAAVRGWPLITRDRQRFAGYFSELELIAPEDPE